MKVLLIVVGILFSTPSIAEDYQSQIETFFKELEKGDVNAAVTKLYKSNEYVSAVPDQIQQVKNQLLALEGFVGELVSLELIDTYNVGGSIVHVTYIAIHERQPIRFEFQFFKVHEGWRTYSMSFDDDLDDEIKTLARMRALEGS